MTFDEFDATVLKRANPPLFEGDQALNYGGLKLAGEAGEYANIIGKLHHGKDLDIDAAAKELGDVLWYVSYNAQRLGLSLDVIATMNDEKLADRHGEQYNPGFYQNANLYREGK